MRIWMISFTNKPPSGHRCRWRVMKVLFAENMIMIIMIFVIVIVMVVKGVMKFFMIILS